MSRLVYFVYDIAPYQGSTTLQLCRTAAAVGNNTIFYVRSQMTGQQTTCREHNATTLSHSSSGRQHHLFALGVSSLCCGELLVSEPVIIRHPSILSTRFCCSTHTYTGIYKNSNNLDTNQPILIHLRPQRQFFNEHFSVCFLRRSQTTDSSRQHG